MKRLSVSLSALLIIVLAAWFWPLPAALTDVGPSTTRILDRNGNTLYELRSNGLKIDVPLSDIPTSVTDGLIATEDRTFRTNPGLSARGMLRAAWHDLKAGRIVEGGSTISQQTIRIALAPKKRTIWYKIREAWLALKLNAAYDKDKILERYLNTAFFGQQSYGLKAAAKTYFDKDPSVLSTGESALLVGLLNAPSSLNPFKDPAAAKKRRDLVLRAMFDTDVLTQEDYDDAIAEPLRLSHGKVLIEAPHFVFWVLENHPEVAQLEEVRTTLDVDLQRAVERIVARKVDELADKNVTAAAVVVLDATTGDILAMVGSRDYFDAEHDGAVNVAVSARQPGSALKPFTYALALANGQTAATTIADVEARFLTQDGNPYVPRNYDYGEHGLVRIREALANSYNIAAVKTVDLVGVKPLLSFLQATGISTLNQTPEHYGLALTLGDAEVTLLELSRSYAMFPRAGKTLVERSLLDEKKSEGTQILDARVAWLISDILSDDEARTAEFGRDGPLNFDFPVAAKTGTTRNSRDNWTIGYTPSRIVGVWVGNADNSPMRDTSGVTGAGPIFHDVMMEAMERLPKTPFSRPSGIVDAMICRLSGKLKTDLCPTSLEEHFVAGTEPKEKDDMYVDVAIDLRNGLRATDACPKNVIKHQVFAIFPPDLRRWARDNGWKSIPETTSPLCSGGSSLPAYQEAASLTITHPGAGATYLLDPVIPDDHEMISFEASAGGGIRSVDWFLNGKKVGTGVAPDFKFSWKPLPGMHLLEAKAGSLVASERFEVVK